MTYRAPIPVGPENEAMTDRLTASRAFTEAMTALTDSSLTLKEAAGAVDDPGAKQLLQEVRERRQDALRQIGELGLANGLRADDVDPSGTEKLRRTWMNLKSKVADDAAVIKVVADGEADAGDKLKDSRNPKLPSAITNAIGSAIEDIENDLSLLNDMRKGS